MIDRALMLLAGLRFRGWLRRLGRGWSSPRGIALFVVGLMMTLLWLLPALFRGAMLDQHSDPAQVRQVAPLWMFAITLVMAFLSGGGKIITFSPADIDFLFPGPFCRHQLVLYKIAITAFAAVWVSLIATIWLGRHATLWVACLIGVWLAWMFAQSLAIFILLARKAVTARRSSLPVRAGMGLLLVLIVAAVIGIARPLLGGEWEWEGLLRQSRDTLAGRIVLAPFDVLTRAFAAERLFPDLLQWTALSAAMIAALVGLILLFDMHFIETALGASESLQARLKRMRRGGGAFSAARPVARFRIGMLPRLGGVGTLAWRQVLTALRGARGLLGLLIVLLVGLAPLLWFMSKRDPQGRPAEAIAFVLAMGGMWLFLVLPSMLRFDFRADLPHMETLKLLPLPPTIIAIGQMLTPVLMITLFTWLLSAIACAAAPQLSLGAVIAAALAPPVLTLVIEAENATFLMFPSASAMMTPGDMTMIGRSMVVLFVKMLAISAAFSLAAGAGGAAYLLARSLPIALAVAWMTLAGLAAAGVPVVAHLFTRFDPSVDRPAE